MRSEGYNRDKGWGKVSPNQQQTANELWYKISQEINLLEAFLSYLRQVLTTKQAADGKISPESAQIQRCITDVEDMQRSLKIFQAVSPFSSSWGDPFRHLIIRDDFVSIFERNLGALSTARTELENQFPDYKKREQQESKKLLERISERINETEPLVPTTSKIQKVLAHLTGIVGGLILTGIMVGVMAIVMNPFSGPITAAAIVTALVTAYSSGGMLFGLTHRVIKSSISIDGTNLPLQVPAPTNLMLFLHLLILPAYFGKKIKSALLNPPKLVAAREAQLSTLNALSTELSMNVNKNDNAELKGYLNYFIDRARDLCKTGKPEDIKRAQALLKTVAEVQETTCYHPNQDEKTIKAKFASVQSDGEKAEAILSASVAHLKAKGAENKNLTAFLNDLLDTARNNYLHGDSSQKQKAKLIITALYALIEANGFGTIPDVNNLLNKTLNLGVNKTVTFGDIINANRNWAGGKRVTSLADQLEQKYKLNFWKNDKNKATYVSDFGNANITAAA